MRLLSSRYSLQHTLWRTNCIVSSESCLSWGIVVKKNLLWGLLVSTLLVAGYAFYYLYGPTPQIVGQQWRVHDTTRPLPEIVSPGQSLGKVAPPPGAIVLFDGRNLDQFTNQSLIIENGAMIMGEGGQKTVQSFGDMQLHVEWASPSPPVGEGQNRGNSGIIMMGLYEVQVLDSYQSETYADGQAAAIYGVQPPLVNASRPPGEWQSYDIDFTAPVFNDDGSLRSPASVTVVHNGVLVQDETVFNGPSTWRRNGVYQAHADKLPLQLQWHGSPVRYRNIWVRTTP